MGDSKREYKADGIFRNYIPQSVSCARLNRMKKQLFKIGIRNNNLNSRTIKTKIQEPCYAFVPRQSSKAYVIGIGSE